MKTLAAIFPIFDHLYIFQILEYRPVDFLKWFLRNPFRRNLQKKHKLEWTGKIRLFYVSALLWMLVLSYAMGWIITVLTIIFLSPLFILLAYLTYLPLEIYMKNKILDQAKSRLASLHEGKIIAITGSYGKTSTKDILCTLLWKKFRVVKTPKSYNTPMGLAQTILDFLKPNTQIFIAEIGAYKKGEIKKLTKFLNPSIGVITAVAPQHLEKFGSLENIAKAKFELVESLPKDGLAILNGQSDWLQTLGSNLRGCIVNFYGRRKDPFYATDIKSGIYGTFFTIHTPKGKTDIQIPLTGEHHVQNFVAAATVAMQLRMTLQEIKEQAKWLQPTPHRLEIKKQGSMTIIDNTYNTNPESSKTSLKLLQEIPGSQKILITPGLVELGPDHSKENQTFAREASKVAEQIIIVGENAKKDLLAGLSKAKFTKNHTFTVPTLNDAMALLGKISKPNAVVLLENDLPDQYF